MLLSIIIKLLGLRRTAFDRSTGWGRDARTGQGLCLLELHCGFRQLSGGSTGDHWRGACARNGWAWCCHWWTCRCQRGSSRSSLHTRCTWCCRTWCAWGDSNRRTRSRWRCAWRARGCGCCRCSDRNHWRSIARWGGDRGGWQRHWCGHRLRCRWRQRCGRKLNRRCGLASGGRHHRGGRATWHTTSRWIYGRRRLTRLCAACSWPRTQGDADGLLLQRDG